MELDQIKAIITMMKENDLSEFSMEQDGLKIRIKRGADGIQQIVAQPAVPVSPVVINPVNGSPAPTPSVAAAAETELRHVTSPMVGTFYRSASPDAASYVEVGDAVTEDTVVCIIEAMKVMNEIKADIKGIITDVLVENAKPVEFGQKLFAVRPH